MTPRSIPISLVMVVALVGVVIAQPKHTPPKTDKEKIANAMSAAPKAVAQEATIVDMDEKGQMKVLREGKGPFTCMPDNPMSPGNDPMCLDKAGMEWAKAWMGKNRAASWGRLRVHVDGRLGREQRRSTRDASRRPGRSGSTPARTS